MVALFSRFPSEPSWVFMTRRWYSWLLSSTYGVSIVTMPLIYFGDSATPQPEILREKANFAGMISRLFITRS